MKKQILFIFLMFVTFGTYAQIEVQPAPNAKRAEAESLIVTDFQGKVYPYTTWHQMVLSGDYNIRRKNPQAADKEFLLFKYTPEEKAEHMKNLRKPKESEYFTTGQTIKPFKITDIYGNKLDAKAWAGKTVVLNFWFTTCPPCQAEIPELNKIAGKYSDNPNVLFIAICLDQNFIIANFIRKKPFGYVLVPDGQRYADMFKIKLYPTNVVIDKDGKVRFHSSGLYTNTAYWIDKTVTESDSGQTL